MHSAHASSPHNLFDTHHMVCIRIECHASSCHVAHMYGVVLCPPPIPAGTPSPLSCLGDAPNSTSSASNSSEAVGNSTLNASQADFNLTCPYSWAVRPESLMSDVVCMWMASVFVCLRCIAWFFKLPWFDWLAPRHAPRTPGVARPHR